MPGTGESIAGGYTIYFEDQHAVTLRNQTLHMLPGNPMWKGDVLVLKKIDKDVVTHIAHQDYETVRKVISRIVIDLCPHAFTRHCHVELLNSHNFQLLSDLLLLSIPLVSTPITRFSVITF
jgi:hypothetical protein